MLLNTLLYCRRETVKSKAVRTQWTFYHEAEWNIWEGGAEVWGLQLPSAETEEVDEGLLAKRFDCLAKNLDFILWTGEAMEDF